MPKVTPRIPSGFVELLPGDQRRFNDFANRVRTVYEQYGFTPIETPAIELTDVLLAKAGGETEKQIWFIDRADRDLALHFDLTVPLARYVAQYEGQLTFPFRRYQMQKVWRGERAQKGRYREFYQFDIDIIGAKESSADAEIVSVIYAVFTALNVGAFTIRVNNRKVLNGLFDALGLTDKATEVMRIVDKVEKIGPEGIKRELADISVNKDTATKILDFANISGSNAEIFEALRSASFDSPLYKQGVEELAQVYELVMAMNVPEVNVKLDLAIARGLDYYTGTVYETLLNDYPKLGSVCSGGRFDNLASYYTNTDLPGVGVSIGMSRLFMQLKEAGIVESMAPSPAQVLVAKTDASLLPNAVEIAASLREQDIATDVYFEADKIGKQFKYADKLSIPFVVVIGARELEAGEVTVSDMRGGEKIETCVPLNEVAKHIRAQLTA